MTSHHHLAQFNVAQLRAPLDSPELADFVALLEPVNRLADTAPGFVWRLTAADAPDATTVRPYGDLVIVNLTVWVSREALWEFTYRSAHLAAVQRRRDWFHRMAQPHHVLWWVPVAHLPTVDEAVDRLARLRAAGPGPDGFTFREPHPPPAGPQAAPPTPVPAAGQVG